MLGLLIGIIRFSSYRGMANLVSTLDMTHDVNRNMSLQFISKNDSNLVSTLDMTSRMSSATQY
jgi:hypothetical protein